MAVITTPEGYLLIDATLSRTGIYEYSAGEMRRMGVPVDDRAPDNAIVRIYRDGAEVFDEASLKSFELKPLTYLHPAKPVDVGTFKSLVHGIVGAPVVADGNHTRTKIQIMSDLGISKYNSGVVQLSAGYSATLDMTPGRTPTGDVYDGRQTKIEINHMAMVPAGRAGTAKLGDTAEEIDMDPKTKADTVDAVAFGEMRQQLVDMKLQLDALTKDRDKLAGENEALKGQVVTDEVMAQKVSAGVEQALKDKAIRDAIVEKAKKLAPKMEIKASDSLKDIMGVAIKAQRPDALLDGQEEAFVRGMFDMLKVPEDNKTQTEKVGPVLDGSLPDMRAVRSLVR